MFTVPLAWLKSHPPLVQDVPVATVPRADFPFEKIPGGRRTWRGGTYRVLFYEYEGRVIWGITAKVLHRMLPFVTRRTHGNVETGHRGPAEGGPAPAR